MFRMYDTDKNGYLDQQEMDSIVDQMMIVAEYMGWETKELRPVSNNWIPVMVKPRIDEYLDPVWDDGGDRLWQWWHRHAGRVEKRWLDNNSTPRAARVRPGIVIIWYSAITGVEEETFFLLDIT